MITNYMRHKLTLQVRTATLGSSGEAVTWADVADYWCRRIPVDVATRLAYQQNNTQVTHKFLLGGEVEMKLGENRIVFDGTVYELQETAMHHEGHTTIMTKES